MYPGRDQGNRSRRQALKSDVRLSSVLCGSSTSTSEVIKSKPEAFFGLRLAISLFTSLLVHGDSSAFSKMLSLISKSTWLESLGVNVFTRCSENKCTFC